MKINEELFEVAADARRSTPNTSYHSPEITAALINYRAAQLISGQLGDIADSLRNIETNMRASR